MQPDKEIALQALRDMMEERGGNFCAQMVAMGLAGCVNRIGEAFTLADALDTLREIAEHCTVLEDTIIGRVQMPAAQPVARRQPATLGTAAMP